MADLKLVTDYLNTLLMIDKFPRDSSNNGLQIEGNSNVCKVAFGVDASAALAESAAEWGADLIFVHHGLSWGDGFRTVTGITARRFSLFFKNNISLYAAHLPLDAHLELGHNALIAKSLHLTNIMTFAEYAGVHIGVTGRLPKSAGLATLAEELISLLGFASKIYGSRKGKVKNIGIISGGAGNDGITAAYDAGVDCLITGEVGHSSWHLIQETGIGVIAGGHYATEVPGVLAVMNSLENMFDVECRFFDIPTGL